MKVVSKSRKIVTHALLIFGSLIMIYPFLFAFLGIFVSVEGFYGTGILPVPESFSHFIENFGKIFRRSEIYPAMLITFGRFVWYTAIVGLTSVLGGYVFAKVNFKFKKVAFYVLMSSMMIPGVAMLIPQYLELSRFPLVGGNDILGRGGAGFKGSASILFVTGWFSAYNIFLIRQALAGLGNEYKEAAEIDGAGFFRTVFGIYTPMLKPVLSVIIIQTFIGQWNDYLFPSLFLIGHDELLPIGVVSVRIQSDYIFDAGLTDYGIAMAMAIFMMAPPAVVYVIFQRNFIAGMSVGGVKS